MEHVIVQVICSFEGDIRNSVSDYVLKVYGLSEYLTSETCLGDYEYVHQCIKLEKDVTLSIIQISELKRPLARTARDDNSLKNLVIEDLLPSETAQPITYDTLRILLGEWFVSVGCSRLNLFNRTFLIFLLKNFWQV